MTLNSAVADPAAPSRSAVSDLSSAPLSAPLSADAVSAMSDTLARTIAEARNALMALQKPDGHWIFELEADATIPAEYILLGHFLGDLDTAEDHRHARIAGYLRATQGKHGGWPLFYAGDFDLSASVKAYFALKLAGDAVDAPHMQRARAAILAHGGAAAANVFTRITLALFGQVPWRAVPVMPVEIMHLPTWFPFHLRKVAYWSRTVIVPLLILMALKPQAKNPTSIDIRELFVVPPEREKRYFATASKTVLGKTFLALDWVLRRIEPWMPKGPRQRAIEAAVKFTTARLNGDDGLGGIFPAMANAVMAYHALGYPSDHPDLRTAKSAIEKLLVLPPDAGTPITNAGTGNAADADAANATGTGDGWAYCQACVSPVWDTCLAAHALMEAEAALGATPADGVATSAVEAGLMWLRDRQILERRGDWAAVRPTVRPGGWAFQYRNDFYPDVDDTAVVAMALHRADPVAHGDAIARAAEWVIGMQSRNGGWGAFDADNTAHYLNHIPFADHGALLDPPTVDVSARCVSFLCQIGYSREDRPIRRALDFIRREQEPDGSWFGRWGTNYIYGTWSAVCALRAAGDDLRAPHIRRAVEWLQSRQREDGGWGEDGASYWPSRRAECKASTASQTAWALLGLMAAGEANGDAVRRGVAFLLAAPRDGCRWVERWYTAVGFPRVFYLRYHGYPAFFPLWALSRYAHYLQRDPSALKSLGM